MGNMQVTAKVPVKLVNGLNTREHWAPKAKRARDQRRAATAAMIHARPRWVFDCDLAAAGDPPITITITRRGGRRMDDDGLTASAKHVRDGIADWLGIDDGDPRLTWVVRQDGAPRGQHWVDVEVTV
jgi:crossover junction endodeoxyribonuclease RusA